MTSSKILDKMIKNYENGMLMRDALEIVRAKYEVIGLSYDPIPGDAISDFAFVCHPLYGYQWRCRCGGVHKAYEENIRKNGVHWHSCQERQEGKIIYAVACFQNKEDWNGFVYIPVFYVYFSGELIDDLEECYDPCEYLDEHPKCLFRGSNESIKPPSLLLSRDGIYIRQR